MSSLADPSKPLGSKIKPKVKLWRELERDEDGLQYVVDVKSTNKDHRIKMTKIKMQQEIEEQEKEAKRKLLGKKKRKPKSADSTAAAAGSSTDPSDTTTTAAPADKASDNDSDEEVEIEVELRDYRKMTDIDAVPPSDVLTASQNLEMPERGVRPEGLDKDGNLGTDKPVVTPRNYRKMTDIETPPPESCKAASMLLTLPKRTEEPVSEGTTAVENKLSVKPRHYRNMCNIEEPVAESMKAAGKQLTMPKRGEAAERQKPKTGKSKGKMPVQEPSVPSTASGSAASASGSSPSPVALADTAATTPDLDDSSLDLNKIDGRGLQSMVTRAIGASALSKPKAAGDNPLA